MYSPDKRLEKTEMTDLKAAAYRSLPEAEPVLASSSRTASLSRFTLFIACMHQWRNIVTAFRMEIHTKC